ncbi:YkvA family protein [Roseofilum reptotaenium CS-1145]|uniref:DUF1232 domain-containing protein n=1 Tax=Roseofilum reptotaenium AO1-A TaxID=1925591 RepID=A0A1L9QX16_9CYAN|nr:YkvA family protein [Roseofilum reptotaenium]MDB9519312.1 YkvA family protein [Roseofilum reptotaenium CS-1145]OJJ27193.1 hypothetical protein BI308_01510 [Roseofilum reptotaenium AO1-A]
MQKRPIKDFESILNKTKPGDESKVDSAEVEKKNRGPVREVWDKVQTLMSTIQNPDAGFTAKGIAIAALLYLISPFDAIPDVIPIVGLTDDVSVIVYAIYKLSQLSSMAKIMGKSLDFDFRERQDKIDAMKECEQHKRNLEFQERQHEVNSTTELERHKFTTVALLIGFTTVVCSVLTAIIVS